MVEMDNGLKYSLYKYAQYEMLTKELGSIDDHGYFRFAAQQDVQISVKYREWEEVVTVDYKSTRAEMERSKPGRRVQKMLTV
jgi:hypothetical protein